MRPKIIIPTVERIKDGYALCEQETFHVLYCNSVFQQWTQTTNLYQPVDQSIPGLKLDLLKKRLEKRGSYSFSVDNVTPDKVRPLPVEFSFSFIEVDGTKFIEIHARNVSKLKEKEALLQSHSLMIEMSNRELAKKTEELNRTMEELKKSYQSLEEEKAKQLEQAYKAGIAENAISVLHNIGNALTPAIVNTDNLLKSKEKTLIATYLKKLSRALEEKHQSADLNQFLKEDIKGKQMLPFLQKLAEQLDSHHAKEKETTSSIDRQLQHITKIIAYQQKYANFQATHEEFEVAILIEDVLLMKQTSLQEKNIQIHKEMDPNLPTMVGDKNKIVQVLLNILTNAIESVEEQLQSTPDLVPSLHIKIGREGKEKLLFSLTDTGKGATKENVANVFQFGFSTKKRGSGFGLHDCANFIRANQGEITLSSPGIGKGATVSFSFPIRSQRKVSEEDYNE